jgi:predicted Zn-dependent protease
MSGPDFRTDAPLSVAPWGIGGHRAGCRCALHGRRSFTAGLAAAALLPAAGPAAAQGVREEVGGRSRLAQLVPAEQVEAAAAAQYRQMLREAAQQRALAPDDHPQVVRLRSIARRMIPHGHPWNRRAARWQWEVNLLGSDQINAFVMPGGKIAFYWGILQRLQLDDDEVAAIMGHEMAHALREHARARMGQTAATRIGANLLSSLLGLGAVGDTALAMGAQLLTLRFSREDEREADIVGLELAARSGYDPAAGIRLWEKMMAVTRGAPPEFLSTHPAGETRIRDIRAMLPKVQPLFEAAERPPRRFGPPPRG